MDLGDITDWLEKVPFLRWITFLLKKVGFLKDFKRLYKTEQKVKALGSAFKKIEIPIQDIIQEESLRIPSVLVFRQKGLPTPATMRAKGFRHIEKSMGLYALPPLKTKAANIKDGHSLEQWFKKEFGFAIDEKTNIRFAVFIDLRDVYVHKHKELNTDTLFEALTPDIIEYLGVDKSLQMVKTHYQKIKRNISEREIIDQTPLLHIFADLVDDRTFDKLKKVEAQMLKEMLESEEIKEATYDAIGRLKPDVLKKYFKKHIEYEGEEDIIGSAIEQARFMAQTL